MAGILAVATLFLLLLLLKHVLHAVYSIFLGPLSSFPGPRLWAASRFPWSWYSAKGTLQFRLKQLHEEYGEVVRIAPDELSFTSAEAWVDIYTTRPGQNELAKDEYFYPPKDPNLPNRIVDADHQTHASLRRRLSPAFSVPAIRVQEKTMHRHIDRLIEQLLDRHSQVQDLVKWLDWLLFDLAGELTFSKSFGCVDTATEHYWVKQLKESKRAGVIVNQLRRFGLLRAVRWFIPGKLKTGAIRHRNFTLETVGDRLATSSPQADFVSFLTASTGRVELTRPEIASNALVLIAAGSETSATVLATALYCLCTCPQAQSKLICEVRGMFRDSNEIRLDALEKMAYLNAVIEEAMRIFPPSPLVSPRRVIGKARIVAGRLVPTNVSVSVAQWACARSDERFPSADIFMPERWLKDDQQTCEHDKASVNFFSLGSHNCIGRTLAYAEMRLVLAKLFFTFDMSLAQDAGNWLDHGLFFISWERKPLYVRLKASRRYPSEVRKGPK